jgi:hypothetical protein
MTVFISVPNDQSGWCYGQDGHMATQLVSIEGGFVVNHIRPQILATKSSFKGVRDKIRVIPTALNILAQMIFG